MHELGLITPYNPHSPTHPLQAPTMAGLTTTCHNPCTHPLSKSLKPHLYFHTSPFRVHFLSTTRYPSISTTTTRYGRGGRKFDSRKFDSDDDKGDPLDIDSVESDTVRLIDDEQNMVGVVSKEEAIRMAEEAELDLVILSSDADPPVLRIMDYNKYKFDQQKKKRDQQKRSAANRVDLKELKMSFKIDIHDYSVRLRAAQKFLKEGDRIKVIVNFKGREHQFKNSGIELLRRFQKDLGELAVEEAKNFRERSIYMLLVPNKAFIQKLQVPSKENSVADQVSNEENSVANEVSKAESSVMNEVSEEESSVTNEVPREMSSVVVNEVSEEESAIVVNEVSEAEEESFVVNEVSEEESSVVVNEVSEAEEESFVVNEVTEEESSVVVNEVSEAEEESFVANEVPREVSSVVVNEVS